MQVLLLGRKIIAQHFVFPSHTYKPGENSRYPLEFKYKYNIMKLMFPNANIVDDSKCITVYGIKKYLKSLGFTKLLMVVGSDRVDDFKKCMTNDNGEYVVCAGNKRISDHTLIDNVSKNEELSATKLREYATYNNFNKFKEHVIIGKMTPDKAFELMNNVRIGLSLPQIPHQQTAGKRNSRQQTAAKRISRQQTTAKRYKKRCKFIITILL